MTTVTICKVSRVGVSFSLSLTSGLVLVPCHLISLAELVPCSCISLSLFRQSVNMLDWWLNMTTGHDVSGACMQISLVFCRIPWPIFWALVSCFVVLLSLEWHPALRRHQSLPVPTPFSVMSQRLAWQLDPEHLSPPFPDEQDPRLSVPPFSSVLRSPTRFHENDTSPSPTPSERELLFTGDPHEGHQSSSISSTGSAIYVDQIANTLGLDEISRADLHLFKNVSTVLVDPYEI